MICANTEFCRGGKCGHREPYLQQLWDFFRVGRVERVYNALVKAYKFVQDISMKHALSYSLVLVDEKQYNLVPPVWLRD